VALARYESIGARACAELSQEGVIEIRDVVKTTVESDIEDSIWRSEQLCAGMTQTGAQNVLVGCEAGELLEYPNKMVTAESDFECEFDEIVPCGGMIFDHADDFCDAGFACWGSWGRFALVPEFKRACGEFNGNFLPQFLVGRRA